jgi:hypothetical protein
VQYQSIPQRISQRTNPHTYLSSPKKKKMQNKKKGRRKRKKKGGQNNQTFSRREKQTRTRHPFFAGEGGLHPIPFY